MTQQETQQQAVPQARFRTREELDAMRARYGDDPVADAEWEKVLARYAAVLARHTAEMKSLRNCGY